MPSTVKPVALIGLGNPLMADEGVGVRLMEYLLEHAVLPKEVDVLELGTSGMTVIHELEGRKRAVFVDCAFMDEPPGTMLKFRPDEVRTRKFQPRLSLHEGDLLQTLKLAEDVGHHPGDVVIFGIQPERVEPDDRLSPGILRQFPRYAEAILSELAAVPA